MNWKNTNISGRGFCPKILAILGLLIGATGCHDRQMPKESPPPAADSLPTTALFAYSSTLPTKGASGILAATNEATVAEEQDHLLIHATGTDAQVVFGVIGAPGRYFVRLEIGSPAVTQLELFYQVQSQPFSAQHVLKTPLKPGRNQLLFLIDDPQFSGSIRLDPGQTPGDYQLYSLQIFASAPVSLMHRPRPQSELAASFNASTKSLFIANNVEAWSKIKAARDAQLGPDANGLSVKATGADPELLLPEFALTGNSIIKIVMVSPAATTLQAFYKTQGQIDYDEAHTESQPLKAGENTIYLELQVHEVAGALRLDPGSIPGDYLFKEIEVRADAE